MKNPLKIGGGSDVSITIVTGDCIIIKQGEDDDNDGVILWNTEINRLIKALQKVQSVITEAKKK